MHRLPTKTKQDGPPPTFLCRNREEVTRALAAIREHMGISQLELDDLAGFNQGYTSKLEQPATPGQGDSRTSGRRTIHPLFDLWVGALKVGIMIVPLNEPESITAPPPGRVHKINYRIAEKIRAMHATGLHTSWGLAAMFGVPRQDIIDVILNRKHTIKVHDARRLRRMAG